MLGKAIALASEAFKDKKDKGGHPYILHLLRVMFSVNQNDEELMCIAILHDGMEDVSAKINCQTLRDSGFSERVVLGVLTLTHAFDVSYDDYIKGIALNEDARQVKLADLKDNSNIFRLKKVTKRDLDRIEKYHRSFIYLSKA